MKRKIQVAAGLILGAGLLWFLFRNADWKAVLAAIRAASVPWLLCALAAMLPAFFTRAVRWSYIVRTAGPVPFRAIFSATQIGFLAIIVMPARLGEIARAVVLGRLARLPFSKCMAMVALDRVTDLVALITVMFVTVLAYTPTGVVVVPKSALGLSKDYTFDTAIIQPYEMKAAAMLVLLIIGLGFFYARPQWVIRISDAVLGVISKKLAAAAHTFLQHFAEGLAIFQSVGDMAKSVIFSLLTWTSYMLVIMATMRAFHIDFPWYAPFLIELLVAVAISVAAAPGFVGQYHAALVVALMLLDPGIDFSKALAFAIVTHLLNMIPMAIIGVTCLIWENFGLVELGRESSKVTAELASDAENP